MPDQLRPSVAHVRLRTAAVAARVYEDQFRTVARAVERMPAFTRPKARQRRGLKAIGYLRTATFWRVIAVEHAEEPPDTLVSDLLGPHELDVLWVEAAERVRMAAREGHLAPGRQGRALRIAAEYVPGEGKLPKRGEGARR